MSPSQTTKAFHQAYAALNKEQKLAVDNVEGPVMVVAGPGTGKTQTIALRLANILLTTDATPSSLLALTFTDSGASAMRARLASLIGTPAYYCHISTFHSFCVEVMQDNPDIFTLSPTGEPLTALASLQLIYQLIDQAPLKLLRPRGAPHYYAKAVLRAISDLKREGASPAKFAKILASELQHSADSKPDDLKNLAKNLELLELYRLYEDHLIANQLFDFDDMITRVVDAFATNSALLSTYQERYQYLLVDEYQDTNSAQNKLLLALASYWGQDANIFVVGDPDQSIYRFQGASIENQLSFLKHYPTARVITLKQNYRSPQLLLDAAASLVSHNNLRINSVVSSIDPHLKSTKGVGDQIKLAAYSTPHAEAVALANNLRLLLKRGVSPGEIAIIYRNNKDANILSAIFDKFGLPFRVQGGQNTLLTPTVSTFLLLLRTIDNLRCGQEAEDLFTLLHYEFFHLEPLDLLKLSRAASAARSSLFDFASTPSNLDSLALAAKSALVQALSQLVSWGEYESTHTFLDFFEHVLTSSGYLNYLLAKPDSKRRISAISTLFEAVKSMVRSNPSLSLNSFLENINLMQENQLSLEDSTPLDSEHLTLTTAHKSKGLEWDYVYIFRAVDRVWGNNKSRRLLKLPEELLEIVVEGAKEKNEDERRLFYVALTRAKKSLTISYSGEVQSMFVGELGPTTKLIDTSAADSLAADSAPLLLAPAPSQDYSQEEVSLLREIVADFSLSATSLNSYLDCAYRFKLDKLFRVPHSKKSHLAFGTAIHAALESLYRGVKESSPPKLSLVLDSFHNALDKESLTKTDYLKRREQGDEILTAYYHLHKGSLTAPLFLEQKLHAKLGDISLSGKIDRIDMLNPSANVVRVVDYKTGKLKGNDPGLRRQLVFYSLLLALSKDSPHLTPEESVLDFVEHPSIQGKDGVRKYQVSQAEIEELKNLILTVMADIRTLHFPRTKNLKTCATCYFATHCYPEGLPREV